MKNVVLFMFIFFQMSFGIDLYRGESEKSIFSFNTKKGKKLSICVDEKNKNVIYRYGTTNKIELQKESLGNKKVFTGSFYMRGGGPSNAGMDLNYFSFINGNYKYTVYYEYYSEGNSQSLGIKIKNLKSDKEFDVKGDIETKKGSLLSFKFDYPELVSRLD